MPLTECGEMLSRCIISHRPRPSSPDSNFMHILKLKCLVLSMCFLFWNCLQRFWRMKVRVVLFLWSYSWNCLELATLPWAIVLLVWEALPFVDITIWWRFEFHSISCHRRLGAYHVLSLNRFHLVSSCRIYVSNPTIIQLYKSTLKFLDKVTT